MMQVSKRVPLENPDVLMAVRAMYILSNVIIAGVYFYTQQQINKKKGAHSQARMIMNPTDETWQI